jgi:CHASE3 domain sensor protein/GAF domain-containing protein
LKIGAKLTLGLSILIALTLVTVAISYFASSEASTKINNTAVVRAPTALAASRTQADLLRMLNDVRDYLVLGVEQQNLAHYDQSKASVTADIERLQQLSAGFNEAEKQSLTELNATFQQFTQLTPSLFDLRDNQLAREPAYKLLATDGIKRGGTVLINITSLIGTQGRVITPTTQALSVLADMSKFQGSFAAILSGLRGYITTRNRVYRGEYEANLDINQADWDKLQSDRVSLTADQQKILDQIKLDREAFLQLPDQMFAQLESPHWREDFYLFSNEAVPLADKMSTILSQITDKQQFELQADLNAGNILLTEARYRTLVGGLVVLVLGILLAIGTRQAIAAPIIRLTQVAEQIREGDLDAQARVESKDETGVLADTFNKMTGQLRGTIVQVRREKKRADDLLEVVIPIGVELASEKDFNRLVERILIEAKTFCHADAGTMYTLTDNKHLKPNIWRNDTLERAEGGTTGRPVSFPAIALYDEATGAPVDNVLFGVAVNGETVNVQDVYAEDQPGYNPFKQFDDDFGYHHTSALLLPVKNSVGAVVGVLELLNAEDPETEKSIPFDPNLQQMMESLTSLAGVALESYIREQALRHEIQQLKIEIDEAKRAKQVSEIVDSDFFQNVQTRARALRQRRQGGTTSGTEGENKS